MQHPPKWAQDLLINACVWWEEQGHAVDLPSVTWRHGSAYLSSGRTFYDKHRIIVTAGRERLDQQLLLLHELAHHLTNGEHHSDIFWDVAWRLYRWAGLPVLYCKKREGKYRKGALVAYRRNRRRGQSL